MYTLGISLTLENTMSLSSNFRYDFLTFDFDYHHNKLGPLGDKVFVFRTIKKYGPTGNVMVDLIDYLNVNGFDAAVHADSHFHNINTNELFELKNIAINDSISIHVKDNEICSQYFACVKNQIIKLNNKNKNKNKNIRATLRRDVEYLLFEKCEASVMNRAEIELPLIFKAQNEHIWHNNRAHTFNLLHKLDIDESIINDSTTWKDVKNSIETKREYWEKESNKAFTRLLEVKRGLPYRVLEC